MSKYINANELRRQGWVAARYINWEPTPLNDNFRLEVEVKPFTTFPAADVQEVVKEWCDERNCIIVAREDFPRPEVRHGRWVQDGTGYYAKCSVCGELVYRGWYYSFCPNCGAKMDEVKDGE